MVDGDSEAECLGADTGPEELPVDRILGNPWVGCLFGGLSFCTFH